MKRAQRLIALVREIAECGTHSAASLAKEFDVSERTIYRDLSAISDTLDGPIFFDKGYKLVRPPLELLLQLSAKESDAVQAFRAAEGDLLLTSTGAELQSVLKRLKPTARPERSSRSGDPLGCLESAIRNHAEVEILYHSLGRGAARHLMAHPLAIVIRRSAWYVVAHSLEHGEARTFRLDRILEVRRTGAQFMPPSDFALSSYLDLSFDIESGPEIRVELLLTNAAAQSLMERRRGRMEQFEERREGKIAATLLVAGEREISRWVMSWGGEAEILQPEGLRAKVAETALALAKIHGAAMT